MDARQQLLQSLMRDLENFQLPERFDDAKKAQIQRGLGKNQQLINKARDTIAENERLYQDALTKRGELQTRIGKLQNEIDTAGAKAEAESPYEQGRQIALFGVPAVAGLGGGYLEGRSLSRGVRERATERAGSVRDLAAGVRSGEIPRVDAARTGQNMKLLGKTRHGVGPLMFGATLAGIGAGQRALAPQLTDNPIGQDVIRGLGGLESGVGTGLVLQQVGSMIKGVPQPSARDIAAIDLPPGSPPPPPPPPDAPALRTPSDRLISAARAAGATGKLTKKTAAEYLTSANINDANRAAVATELGVGPGQRIASAVKRLSTSRTPSSLIGPLAAAGLAYDAVSGDAEAAGATPGEARTQGAVVGTGAAAATGGTLYGLNKLAQAGGPIASVTKNALSAVGRMSGPMMLNDLAMQAHRGLYGEGPQYLDVPERSPTRSVTTGQNSGPLMQASALELPTNIPDNANQQADIAAGMTPGAPPNALAAAGQQPDAFGLALKDFLAFVAEEQAGQQQ